MKPNRLFKIVFQPKDRTQFEGKRRFAVGAGSLHKYIGLSNANVAIRAALSSDQDKHRIKFRTRGIVDFYYK